MTTIAYKDGVMACDTAVFLSEGRKLQGLHCDKVFFTGNGLIGIAGDADESYITEEWLQGIVDLATLGDALDTVAELPRDIDCIVVFKDEPNVVHYAGTVLNELKGEVQAQVYTLVVESGFGAAMGSGGKYAEVAMACGLSAADAVTVACQYDNSTGGNVEEYILE